MFRPDSLRAFTRDLVVFAKATPAAMVDIMVDQAHIQIARVEAQQSSRSGVVPSYRQVVNGVADAAFESWRPPGKIVLIWSYLIEVVIAALRLVAQSVPVRTGNLLENIVVFADGTEIERGPDASFLVSSPALAEVSVFTIMLDVPYARRLEVGLNAQGEPFVRQVKQHFVEQTAIILGSIYRYEAEIGFNYESLANAPSSRWTRGMRRRRQAAGEPMRFPTITIKPRLTG